MLADSALEHEENSVGWVWEAAENHDPQALSVTEHVECVTFTSGCDLCGKQSRPVVPCDSTVESGTWFTWVSAHACAAT